MPDSTRVRTLRRNDWPIIERLFGEKGACAGCWCMYWRSPFGGRKFEARKGEPNRKDFEKLVTSGAVHGVLAFSGRDPVGWCSIGPREDFPYLERSRVLKSDWSFGTWSVTCFFIATGYRRRGVATAMLDHAVTLAKKRGATELEGYPVRTREDGRKVAAAFAWTGVPALFESAGFEPIDAEVERPVYRRRLS